MALPKLPVMTEKHRLIASIAVIALGSISLGTAWGFGFKKARALETEVAEVRAKREKARKELDGLEDLRRRVRESAALERRLGLALPDAPELERVFEILKEAEELAGKAPDGIDFTIQGGKLLDDRAKTDRRLADKPYQEFSLEIQAAGSWAAFVSFLDSLEHSDRLIAIRSFKTTDQDKVTPLSTKINPLFFEYTIVATVYRLKGEGDR